jgi:hypothetical protein
MEGIKLATMHALGAHVEAHKADIEGMISEAIKNFDFRQIVDQTVRSTLHAELTDMVRRAVRDAVAQCQWDGKLREAIVQSVLERARRDGEGKGTT